MPESPDLSGRGLARRFPIDAGFLIGTVLSSVVYMFIARGGFPDAAQVGSRGHYYTEGALSILHGHLYVPPKSLGNECFMLGGHCFGYFGITPSLLRLPVVAILGDRALSNGVEAVFFLLGFLTVAAGGWWIARQLIALWAPSASDHALWVVGFLAALGTLGATPLLFLASRPLVYEEAILWGVGFAAVALGAAISVRLRPRAPVVAVLVGADVLAVLARPTVGYSAIFATVVFGLWLLRAGREAAGTPEASRHTRWGIYLATGAVVAVVSAPAVLYAKFGTVSLPYKDDISVSSQPDQLRAVSHPLGINPASLPTKLFSVLRPDTLEIVGHPPYVELGDTSPLLLWPAKPADVAGVWEPTASITATLPFDAIAGALGVIVVALALGRRHRAKGPHGGSEAPAARALWVTVVAFVSALGAVTLDLLFPGQTYRYIADWLPLLDIAVAVGLGFAASRLPQRAWQRVALVGVACLVLGAQLFIQTGLAISFGLRVGGERPAVCPGPPNPYGVLGRVFCSKSL